MEYRIRHITRAVDTQCDFGASFSYAFLDLVILPTATCSFQWKRVSNKPARWRFSVEVMPSILPTTCVCLVVTWYERNSTFQHLYVRAAFFLLFIIRVNCINNATRDFLGAQRNHVCCKKQRLRKQRIAPLIAYFWEVIPAIWVKFLWDTYDHQSYPHTKFRPILRGSCTKLWWTDLLSIIPTIWYQ